MSSPGGLDRYSLAAPPSSGKLSRKEKVTRSGRASIDATNSPSHESQLHMLAAQHARNGSQQFLIPENIDNPFAAGQPPPQQTTQPQRRPSSAAVDFFTTPAVSSSGAPMDDLFAFFDPLAEPVRRNSAATTPQKPVQQQSAPQPASGSAEVVDPFSQSFTMQMTFDPPPAAAATSVSPVGASNKSPSSRKSSSADKPPPHSARKGSIGAGLPAPALPPRKNSIGAGSAAAPAAIPDDSSDDDDSDDSDSDESSSSEDEAESAAAAAKRHAAKSAKKTKADERVSQLNKSSKHATRAAESVAHTHNKSIAVGPGGAGASQASTTATAAAAAAAAGAPILTVDVLAMMHKGCAFLKYGKSGYPHFRQFQLSADNSRIQWFSSGKKPSATQIVLSAVDQIQFGQGTANFARHPAPDLAKSSFSLLYDNGKSTLDLIAKDPNEFQIWTRGLAELLRRSQTGYPGELETLKTLPLHMGIATARRSSVDITDMTTGKPANQLGVPEEATGRPRALSTGNKQMYKEVATNFQKIKYKLNKRREELREHQYYLTPEYPALQAIVTRVQDSINKCADLFQDGEYAQCDDECWRAGVDLESLKNMMSAVKRP